MSDLSWRLQTEAEPWLRAGELLRCDQLFCEALCTLPESPFHVVLNLQFRTSPILLACYFDEFLETVCSRRKIGAAYAEMNSFDINTDLWYFNLFTYQFYGGHADYDWLAHWDSEPSKEFALAGMEELQRVFKTQLHNCRDRSFEDQAYVTGLIVVSRFQQLIARTAPLMKRLSFPLLSTAHEYDFVAEVRGYRV